MHSECVMDIIEYSKWVRDCLNCVCERERERESVCVCVCVSESFAKFYTLAEGRKYAVSVGL